MPRSRNLCQLRKWGSSQFPCEICEVVEKPDPATALLAGAHPHWHWLPQKQLDYHLHQQVGVLSLLFLCIHIQRVLLLLCLMKKKPSTASRSQSINPSKKAASLRAERIFSRVPSSCHMPSQRCDADLEAHCSPLGKSTHREPVINTQKMVLQTFRQGVCGFPFGRFEGSAGNRGPKISH